MNLIFSPLLSISAPLCRKPSFLTSPLSVLEVPISFYTTGVRFNNQIYRRVLCLSTLIFFNSTLCFYSISCRLFSYEFPSFYLSCLVCFNSLICPLVVKIKRLNSTVFRFVLPSCIVTCCNCWVSVKPN